MTRSSASILLALALGAFALAVGLDPGDRRVPNESSPGASDTSRPYGAPGERAEFFELQRRPVDGSDVSPARRLDALREIRARERALGADRAGGPGGIHAWAELGPGNIGGRTRTLVFDPTDPDVMYSGGTSGGVWKSTDAGASWTALDDTMASLAVTSIVIDPTDPSVLYAGTGEGFFSGTGPAGRGFGVFRSADAGATWTQLPGTANPFFYYVNTLVISPNDPDRVYAGTRTGVWRTTDAGDTWDLVLANPDRIVSTGVQESGGCLVGCTDMVVRADRDPDVLFASFGSFQADGLFRSDDGGDTWVRYTVPGQQGRMSLALAPSDNDVLYLCMANNGSSGQLGRLVQLYRSTDGGLTFEPRADLANDPFAPNLLTNMVIALGCFEYPAYSQGWYDNVVAVDPTDPDVVWVGGIALSRSDDGGATWGRAGYYFGYPKTDPVWVHPDFHGVFFHPGYDGATNQTAFVSNDGGLYRTDNARAAVSTALCPEYPASPEPGVEWTSLNNGYGVTQFYHGDTTPQADLYIGGAQDNGTSAVSSATDPDGWRELFGGDGGYVAIDPTDPDVIYVEIQFFPEIRKSTDGGQTFADAVDGITDTDGLFISPFAMDKSDPDVLWTGGSRPWRTTDGAASWQLARATPLAAGGKISAVAVAPSDGSTVYLGTSAGRVYRSTDALAPAPAWDESDSSRGLIDGAYVSSMAVHPTDPDTAYLTYSNYGIPHVYRTTNGGLTWSPLGAAGPDGLPDIPAHWIAVRPSDPSALFVATELGVFASEDAGATWLPSPGIPNTIVESLVFQDDDRLVAFTHGRGAWLASFTAPPAACPGDIDGDGATLLSDFGILAGNFGQSVPPNTGGDFDGDGQVLLGDFGVLAADFGCTP